MAARERAEFLAGHPLLVGLSGDLPEPGSFITIENACRHRGTRVVDDDRDDGHRFTCQLHNWSYGTDGALVGVPKRDHFGDIDDARHGLVRLPAVEQYGMLWVHPDQAGTIDIDAMLTSEPAEELQHWRLDELHCADRDHYDVACYETFGRNPRFLLCRRSIDGMRHSPREEWNIAVATLPGPSATSPESTLGFVMAGLLSRLPSDRCLERAIRRIVGTRPA